MAHSKYLGFLHVHLTFLSGRAFRGFHSVLSPKKYLRHVPEMFAVAALERCHSPTVISSFMIFMDYRMTASCSRRCKLTLSSVIKCSCNRHSQKISTQSDFWQPTGIKPLHLTQRWLWVRSGACQKFLLEYVHQGYFRSWNWRGLSIPSFPPFSFTLHAHASPPSGNVYA